MLSSCSEEGPNPGEIWDFAPHSVLLDICDSQGDTRLDPEASNTIVGCEVSIEHMDKVYDIVWMSDAPWMSRYCPAIFYGIWHHKMYYGFQDDGGYNPWIIEVGQFASDANYDYTIALYVDGDRHTLRLKNSFHWKGGKPKIDGTLYVDGERQDSWRVTIIKDDD